MVSVGGPNDIMCWPFTPMDNSVVGNDLDLVLELDSADRAVSQLGTAALLIRDDDSKWKRICICIEDINPSSFPPLACSC